MKIKERIKELNEYKYFQEREGLAEEIAKIEEKTKIKLSNQFTEYKLPIILYGDIEIQMGSIGQYYFLSFKNKEEKHYKIFETKQEIKLFVSQEGIDKDILPVLLSEIEKIKFFI